MSNTANDPNLTICTVHTFDVDSLEPKHKRKHKSDFLSYWRVYGESDSKYSARLSKALKDGKITYSEMLKLTEPLVPQADPLNPAPKKENKTPWE